MNEWWCSNEAENVRSMIFCYIKCALWNTPVDVFYLDLAVTWSFKFSQHKGEKYFILRLKFYFSGVERVLNFEMLKGYSFMLLQINGYIVILMIVKFKNYDKIV